MPSTERVGALLVTYQHGDAPHVIRWIRQSDFVTLQREWQQRSKLDEDAASILAQITGLRRRGVTDQQLASSGLDIKEFERIAHADGSWPIISYGINRVRGALRLKFGRARTLQLRDIVHLELAQLHTVESP